MRYRRVLPLFGTLASGWFSSSKAASFSGRLRWILFGSALSLAACQGPQEELLTRFLEAVQRGDTQTANLLSTRALPGPIQGWSLGEFTVVRSEAYAVPDLRSAVKEAERARDDQFKTYSDFRQNNYGQLSRIQSQQQERPDQEFTGRLKELRDEWERQRLERRDKVRALQEAEISLASEIKRVEKSLQRPSTPEYLTGEVIKSDVDVVVAVGGENKPYRITISKYQLKNQFDAVVPARWIITDIEEQ